MNKKSNCTNCDACDTIETINGKISSIADKRLYNIRYELGREVDYPLYTLLKFYKELLESNCNNCEDGSGFTPCVFGSNALEKEVTLQNIVERVRMLIN